MKVSKDSVDIGRQLAEKTFRELGLKTGKYGKLREIKGVMKIQVHSRNSPVTSRILQ